MASLTSEDPLRHTSFRILISQPWNYR